MNESTVPRPTFHFTPRRNWMNDPNGLVHHRGVWHLFFQYNPDGSDWGNMSWGHATSVDLETWTEQPIALLHRQGEQIFSGSIVVSSDDPDELTAIYTSAYEDGHQAQSRATSADAGATWQEDPCNPILIRWALTVSTNPIDDRTDPEGSTMGVILGRFDGTSFTSEATAFTQLDHGRDFYAGVTFDSAPGGVGVMLGWMSNWRYAAAFPSNPWRGAMSLPRTLALRSVGGQPRLIQRPLATLTARLAQATPIAVQGSVALPLSGHSLLELTWEPAATGSLRLALRGDIDAFVDITYDSTSRSLIISRGGPAAETVHPDFAGASAVPVSSADQLSLLVVLDGPLLELFLNGGEATASQLVVLGTNAITADLSTERGSATVTTVDMIGTQHDILYPQAAAPQVRGTARTLPV